MQALLNALGNPEQALPPTVHIAGTNGKGSLVALLGAMGEAQDLSVHRYISPHLVRFHERITLAGQQVSDALLLPALQRVQSLMAHYPVTFFEATTAAALLLFAEHPADLLLLEVGMGGRLDATNVIPKPLLTVITPIAMDHQEYLGNSISAIAAEKAGILKENAPCVFGRQGHEAFAVLSNRAGSLGCKISAMGWEFRHDAAAYLSPTLTLSLSALNLYGAHQRDNAATAIACGEMLGFSPSAMQKGLATAVHPARMQRLRHGPLLELLPENTELWLDGGHNPGAGAALAAHLPSWADKPLHILVGMKSGKGAAGFIAPLLPFATSLLAVQEPGQHLAMDLAEIVAASGGVARAGGTVAEALAMLPHAPPGRVLICGSLYLAGEVLKAEAA
jgi:dihydrofolate synthase/folylpolyglutamate synthase